MSERQRSAAMADWNGADRNGSGRGAAFTPATKPANARPPATAEHRGRAGRPRQHPAAARGLRRGRPGRPPRRLLRRRATARSTSICSRCTTAGSAIDLMLLVERLKKAEVYESIGGAAYLAEVGQQVPTAAHAEYYARIVADKAVLRSLIHASTEIQAERTIRLPTPARCSARPKNGLFAFSKTAAPGRSRRSPTCLQRIARSHRRPDGARKRVRRRGNRIHRFRSADRRPAQVGTGDPGRPAQMGKTALAMNIAEHAALERHARRCSSAWKWRPSNWATAFSAPSPASTAIACATARSRTKNDDKLVERRRRNQPGAAVHRRLAQPQR